MQKYLRNAIAFILVVFALLAIVGSLTGATEALKTTKIEFLAIAALFFIFSIILWLISWAYLIKNRNKIALKSGLFVGFSAVYAALTPIQLGADMLRAISLKERFGIPYTESIAASMVVKGAKFLLIALLSTTVILAFILSAEYSLVVLIGLLSGFAVVLLATLLFLLPLKRSFGSKIATIFKKISRVIKPAAKLHGFFNSYSLYLSTLGKKSFVLVAVLAAASLLFEFMALLFSFYTVSLALPLVSIAILFILVSILERTPFLPRGIGLVEGIGFAYLSMPFVSLQPIALQQIGALLIVFDFVRLVVPSIASIAVYTAINFKK